MSRADRTTLYYSSGNYESFARPRKPEGVENKTAWFVGAGLASLAGAAFLIRDGQMPGEKITVLERLKLPGGALDGIKEPEKGFVIRGGREMENHFECLWDLFRSIPSIEIQGASVLDEFYWLNKDDPNCSLQRATVNRGQDAHTDGMFSLSAKTRKEIMKIFLATREEIRGQAHRRGIQRRVLREQLLALLAHHVRLRGVAQRAGDETVPAPLHSPHRRPA